MIKLKIGHKVLIITGNNKKKTTIIKSCSKKNTIKITNIGDFSKPNTFISISNVKNVK